MYHPGFDTSLHYTIVPSQWLCPCQCCIYLAQSLLLAQLPLTQYFFLGGSGYEWTYVVICWLVPQYMRMRVQPERVADPISCICDVSSGCMAHALHYSYCNVLLAPPNFYVDKRNVDTSMMKNDEEHLILL